MLTNHNEIDEFDNLGVHALTISELEVWGITFK